MFSEKLGNQVFLFASNKENPDAFFQGYCFYENDYIFGDQGAKDFYANKGVEIGGGEDGCYVTARKSGQEYTFSCDFSGNKKVFYYWTPDIWVVSNSIFMIAEHLKSSSVKIKANYTQLKAIGIHRGTIFNQLYSINTLIEGVKLLPTGASLNISVAGYVINKHKNRKVFDTYEEGLAFFIRTWIARLAGLLNNDIEIQSDLTGGADSRTVFSILKHAYDITNKYESKLSFRSGATDTNKLDLEIAQNICEFYSLQLNNRSLKILNRFSGEDSYFSWKSLCLGIYHPVYFPSHGPQHHIVNLGGAGAENHRHFYKHQSINAFIESGASKITPNWLAYNFKAEIESEMNRMCSVNPNTDPLILHYREYRNRMHSGRTPQYKTSFNPLGSKILQDVSDVAGARKIRNGQINYDIMATLLPALLEIPFDHPSKELNENRKQDLTVLHDWGTLELGNVYIDSDIKDTKPEVTKSALELLNIDFKKAKTTTFNKDFLGEEFITKASFIMSEALKNKKFPHAIDAQYIVAVIAGGLFD